MPTLTINGQKVTVDDSFDKLAPAQQEATIEEIAKSFGASTATPTASAVPAESTFNQALRGAVTAGVRGLGGALDFMVDPTSPLRTILNPTVEKMEPRPWHPGAALGDKFFEATGIREMQPETPWGRIGLAAGTGLVGGGPFGLVKGAMSAAPGIWSAVGGGLGQGVMEAAPGLGVSPDNTERLATAAGLAPAAVVPLVRGGVNIAARQARETFGPNLSEGYRQGRIGEELRATASDPEAFARSLLEPRVPDLVPGSKPTTFQYTADPGIGQMERTQRLLSPIPGDPMARGPAPFLERMQEQSAKRVEALQGLAPEGAAPGAVRDLFKQELTKLDTEGEANIRAATQNAMQAMEQAGGKLNPEEYGALIRDQLEAAKAATKLAAKPLFDAIDPDGTLTIDGMGVRREASRIVSEISKMARQPEGVEAEVFANARILGSEAKFSDFSALRGNVLQAIREERVNGETPALRRLQQLRSSMDDAMSNIAETAAARNPELFTRLTAADEQVGQNVGVEAAAQARGNNPIGAVGSPEGSALVPGGALRAVGDQASGPGGVAGSAGVPGEVSPVANFNEAAAVRVRAANDAWRTMKERFNNQLVGPVLQERGGGEYRMLESRVPERFLSTPEGVQAFMDAGGTPATLKDALVGDLRRSALAPDGSLNVGKYQSWLKQRAAALRAFPETEQALGNAAGAQETVDTATAAARQQRLDLERGAARHFLNAEPTQAVQSALGGKNPIGDMTELARMTGGDPAAKAGLERAVAEYVERNFIGNADALKSDAFQTFINRSGPALAQVFTPSQMLTMRNIAADLKRSNMSIAGSKIPGGSDTAQNAMLLKGRMSVLSSYLGPAAAAVGGGLAMYLIPGMNAAEVMLGAIGGGSGKRVFDNMKAAGVQKLDALRTEALLNPEVAAALLMKATPANRPFIAAKLNAALGRVVGSGAAVENLKKPPKRAAR